MRTQHVAGVMMAAVAAGMLAGTAVGIPVAAQTRTVRQTHVPAGAHPDLNGIWQALNEANYDLLPHMARPAMELRAGPYGPLPAAPVLALGAVGSVPPGPGVVVGDEIPYQPWAAAKKKENQENWLSRDPEVKCYLPGVPRATYMPYPFQIFQNNKAVFVAYEYDGATRNIYMADPGPPPADAWMGQSVGRWEHDTLVVDVTGFNEETWFDRAGNFHSDALHVIERYTRTSPDSLLYEATIEDPKVFTRPWKISMPLYRILDKNAKLLEYECVYYLQEERFRKAPFK